MRANLMVPAIMLASGSLSLSQDLAARATWSPTAVAAAQSELHSVSSIEGLSISRQS